METPIAFKNKDGKQLVGILHMPEKPQNTIIICHGFGGNKTDKKFVELARSLAMKNFCVFRFDFTAHGDSEGTYEDYSVKTEVSDLDAAIRFLETFETIDTDNIGLVGHSLGAAVCILYAKDNKNIKSLALLAPALDLRELVTLWYPKEQVYDLKLKGKIDIEKHTITKEFFDESSKIDLKDVVVDLEVPRLIIHGEKDDTIPVGHTKELVKKQSKGLEIELLENSGHKFDDLKSRKTIKQLTVKWFEKWMR